MKKVLVLAVICGNMFMSCKKQDEKNIQKQEVNYSQLEESSIVPAIKDFKDKIKSASDEENYNHKLSIENAVWLAEAAINFDYAVGNTILNQSTFSEEIAWENESKTETNLKEAIELYSSIDLAIKDFIRKNNRKIVLVDVSVSAKNKIKISVVNGEEANNAKLPAACLPFGATDYWSYTQGKCGPYAGQNPESGSPAQLTTKLNAKCVTEICNNGGRIVYTNIVTTQIMGVNPVGDNTTLGANILNPYDVTVAGDGITDFCLYYGYGSSAHTCFAPDEMNAYVSSIKYLANLNKPAGKEIINYNVQFDACLCGGPSTTFHRLTFTSGTKTCVLDTN